MLAENQKRKSGERREKMKTTDKKDRRLHPRVDQNLPINVVANGYDFITHTRNVSCVGAYCHIDKYVPPFTKVRVRMNLPLVNNGTKRACDVECYGVIVRTEDEAAGGFNIAIFFSKIKDQLRNKLAQYVSQCLVPNPCSPN
jgi:hypothetical protein